MHPYRKPTQVVKERILRCSSESWLRNSAKWPCNFGRRGAYPSDWEAAVKRPRRLFSKNTWLCELERVCIRPDTCPVPEG